MLSDLTISLILMRLTAVLVIAAVQGASIAGTAILLGDRGPRYDARLSALPFRHLDLVGTVCAVLFGLGWTRPVAIDANQFRIGRGGLGLVVLAGFVALLVAAVLLLALILPALQFLPYTAGLTTAAALRVAAQLCVWVALFNLLPIPPLTAGHLLAGLGVTINKRIERVLMAGLLVALATGLAKAVVAPVYALLAPLVLGAAQTGV